MRCLLPSVCVFFSLYEAIILHQSVVGWQAAQKRRDRKIPRFGRGGINFTLMGDHIIPSPVGTTPPPSEDAGSVIERLRRVKREYAPLLSDGVGSSSMKL